jgi:hypothetical protein
VVAVVTVAALAAIIAVVWPVTDLIAAHDVGVITGTHRASSLQAAREAVRTQLLTLGAGVFAAGALVYAARSFTLSRNTFMAKDSGARIAAGLALDGYGGEYVGGSGR